MHASTPRAAGAYPARSGALGDWQQHCRSKPRHLPTERRLHQHLPGVATGVQQQRCNFGLQRLQIGYDIHPIQAPRFPGQALHNHPWLASQRLPTQGPHRRALGPRTCQCS